MVLEFQLNIYHQAENEAGLNTFLVYIKDNMGDSVTGAQANSITLKCDATFTFATYNELVSAIIQLKGQFDINYSLQVNITR